MPLAWKLWSEKFEKSGFNLEKSACMDEACNAMAY